MLKVTYVHAIMCVRLCAYGGLRLRSQVLLMLNMTYDIVTSVLYMAQLQYMPLYECKCVFWLCVLQKHASGYTHYEATVGAFPEVRTQVCLCLRVSDWWTSVVSTTPSRTYMESSFHDTAWAHICVRMCYVEEQYHCDKTGCRGDTGKVGTLSINIDQSSGGTLKATTRYGLTLRRRIPFFTDSTLYSG